MSLPQDVQGFKQAYKAFYYIFWGYIRLLCVGKAGKMIPDKLGSQEDI